MKTRGKRILSLMLCLVMVLTLLPTVAFAEDAIPITTIEATSSEFTPPVYGAANTYYHNCHFEVTNGAQVRIPDNLAKWMKVTEIGGLEDYTDSTFTEGTYRFVCHVRTDGTAYTFTKDTTVKVNGVTWTTVGGNLGTVVEYDNGFKTSYYTLTYSPSFVVKKSGTLITDLPITAAWDASCQTISSYSAAQAGFTVSKVEMAKNGVAITKATPGDTINVAFTVQLDPGYVFDPSCHAYWNGEQETAKLTGSADNEKRFVFKVTVPTPVTEPATEVVTIPIYASWNDTCQYISSCCTTALGCRIAKVELVKNGVAISKATPGDTINVAFTVELNPGYAFASNCHAYWNGEQETAKIAGSADNVKRFAYRVTVPTPAISAVTITGIDKPVVGQHPDTTFNIDYANDLGIYGAAEWYEYENGLGRCMSDTEVFRTGYKYGCTIYLYALEGTFRYRTEVDDYDEEYDVFDGTLTVNGTPTTGYITMNATRLRTRWWYDLALSEDCGGNPNACALSQFKDAPGYSNWAHKGIEYCVSKGLMSGTSATMFSPKTSMSRAMLVTVLYRMAGQPGAGQSKFSDVPANQWYSAAVSWAADKGIVSGVGGGRFDPNGNVTREQIATILFRYASFKGYNTSKRDNLSGFADASKVGSWFVDGMKWAVAEGLITGTVTNNKTYLNPQGAATREQVAAILMRFCENVAK